MDSSIITCPWKSEDKDLSRYQKGLIKKVISQIKSGEFKKN
jgi:hypothetical protein